jgi:dolichol kinase
MRKSVAMTKLEMRRKLIHMASLVIPLGYIPLSKTTTMIPLVVLTALLVFFDIIRHYHEGIRRVYEKHLIGTLVRKREQNRLVGSTYFMIGACLCVWFLDKHIAIVSLLVLIISDTLAALAGTTFGRIALFGSKTLEGSTAFLLSAVFIVLLYPGVPLLWGLIGALTATLVELLPLRVDDNLLIPLVMGFTIQGLSGLSAGS